MIIQCLYEMKMFVLLRGLIKNNIFFICFLVLSVCHIQTHAQADKNKNEQDFNSFKNKTEEAFLNFKVQNDSIFLKTLEGNWKEFKVFSEERIQRIKPKIQPVAKKDTQKTKIRQPDIHDNIEKIEQREELPEMEQPPDDPGQAISGSINVDFFGETHQITKPDRIPLLPEPDSKNIIRFYEEYLQNQKLIKTTLEIYTTAKEIELNDWGYLIFLKSASEKLFSGVNERVLYTWISLLKTGYNARIGYDEQNICLLTATDGTLFNTRSDMMNKTSAC